MKCERGGGRVSQSHAAPFPPSPPSPSPPGLPESNGLVLIGSLVPAAPLSTKPLRAPLCQALARLLPGLTAASRAFALSSCSLLFRLAFARSLLNSSFARFSPLFARFLSLPLLSICMYICVCLFIYLFTYLSTSVYKVIPSNCISSPSVLLGVPFPPLLSVRVWNEAVAAKSFDP